MRCTEKQHKKVLQRGASVKAGYFERLDLYPNPAVLKTTFDAQLEDASNAQAAARGGGKLATSKRDTEVGKLFYMLRFPLLLQVNELYEGNRTNLDASGFGVSKDPAPQAIPDPPNIRRIEDANYSGSYGAKIILLKKNQSS
jgi:hypothetical protein